MMKKAENVSKINVLAQAIQNSSLHVLVNVMLLLVQDHRRLHSLASKLLAIGLGMRSWIFLERAWKFQLLLLLKPVGRFYSLTEQIIQL